METDRRLRAFVADMVGPIAAGRDADAHELAQMLNALFGIELSADAILSTPTPDAVARSIESAWFDGGGSAEELTQRLAALADDE
jgi:hypothetical protein